MHQDITLDKDKARNNVKADFHNWFRLTEICNVTVVLR